MAVQLNPGTGGVPASADLLNASTGLNGGVPDITAEQVQRVKVGFGSDSFLRDVDAANPLPVVSAGLPPAFGRTTLLSAVTAIVDGAAVAGTERTPSFTASVTGTGAVSATVLIESRNAVSGVWVLYCTLIMSGTTSAADAFPGYGIYMEFRARLTAISGTSAAVTATMAG
jgi:hypothetical protein